MMDKNANAGAADGKVKVELGDDPQRTGEYSFGFTINNLKDIATSFNLSADFFTQDLFEDLGYTWLDTQTAAWQPM